MRIFNRSIIKLSIFLTLILISGQTVLSQEKHCEGMFWFNEILSKFTTRRTISPEPVNKKLIGEVVKRKVGFVLDEADEKMLKDAGASDLLIKTIYENVLPEAIEAKSLYEKYLPNYESNDTEKLKVALEAAKEFVRKFENNECYAEHVKYFKEVAIPFLENHIEGYGKIHPFPSDPKIDLKYKLLGKIEKAYKIKNWDEVFVIGEQVLEIDPEFIDLIVVLAGIGFDQAKLYEEKSKFNSETVRYAELAVKLLETGNETKNKYGAFVYQYKTKAEALDKMKEILGFMKNLNTNTPKRII